MFIKVEDFMIMPHTVKNLTLVAADAAVATLLKLLLLLLPAACVGN